MPFSCTAEVLAIELVSMSCDLRFKLSRSFCCFWSSDEDGGGGRAGAGRKRADLALLKLLDSRKLLFGVLTPDLGAGVGWRDLLAVGEGFPGG